MRSLEDTLTSLYETNTVIFFEPRLIALTALSILLKENEMNLVINDLDNALTNILTDSEEQIKVCREYYLSKKKYLMR